MLKPKTILHIDDDDDDLFLFRYAITSIDQHIILHTAPNGIKAIEFLQQAKLFGDLPGLIILDINMPVMNGLETLTEIKKDSEIASIPLIVFSTALTDKDEWHFNKENIPAFKKPVTFKNFVDCAIEMMRLYKPSVNNKSSGIR